MTRANRAIFRKQTPEIEGASIVSSPTGGTTIYVSPGGWKLLLRIVRWLLALGGVWLYAGTSR